MKLLSFLRFFKKSSKKNNVMTKEEAHSTLRDLQEKYKNKNIFGEEKK
jgi:hypothetical protein